MAKYVVFESGSRAGMSAERFFIDYITRHPECDDVLYTSDRDTMYATLVSPHPRVIHIDDERAFELLRAGDMAIFPADELTRQCNDLARDVARGAHFSHVEPWYYDKRMMNNFLAAHTTGCEIAVPRTFDVSRVCLRPNAMSAGTRGVSLSDSLCVTERIDIEHEYVVDVLRTDATMQIYPREVTLKNGYDRYLRFEDPDGELGRAVVEFIEHAAPYNEGIFSDIFHLQLCRDTAGRWFYIESSKRISGTAMVNLCCGMNPFDVLAGGQPRYVAVDTSRWHRFEDLLVGSYQ